MSDNIDEEEVVIDLIKEEFNIDPLFQEIEADIKLRDELFPDFLGSLNLSKTYTTKEVAEMCETNDSNVRYYMTHLAEYIQPIKNNRNYRLNYKSVYQLYLVFLYIRDYGRNMNDVKALLPIFGVHAVVMGNGEVINDTGIAKKDDSKKPNTILFEEMAEPVINLMAFSQDVSESVAEVYVSYIETVQINRKIRELEKVIRENWILKGEEDKKLERLRSELVSIKNILRADAQSHNMTEYFKKTHEEISLGSIVKKMLGKKQEVTITDKLMTVDYDNPKILSKKEEIDEQEKIIDAIINKIKNAETELTQHNEKLSGVESRVQEVMGDSPQFEEYDKLTTFIHKIQSANSQYLERARSDKRVIADRVEGKLKLNSNEEVAADTDN